MSQSRTEKSLPKYFFTSVILIIGFTVLSAYLLQEAFEAARWIEHRRQIQVELDGVQSSIFEMEAAKRGYFLTKDENVSAAYDRAGKELKGHIAAARSLTEDQHVALSLDSLKLLVISRVGLLEDIDSIFTNKGVVTPLVRQKIVDGDALMDKVRAITQKLHQRQEALLNERISDRSRQRTLVYLSILLFALIAIVVISSGFIRLKRDRLALMRIDSEKESLISALAKSETRYRSLNASSHDAILVFDASRNILSWNESAHRIFGYTEAEAVGQPLKMVIPSYDDGDSGVALKEVLETGTSSFVGQQVELQGLRKKGQNFPAELTLSTWMENGIHLFSATIRDITRQREMSDHLHQTLAELERSNKELEQFAYVASHDLQEPLRKIRAFSDRLISKMENPEENKEKLLDYSSRMANAAERMQGLIQDLLAFSRVSRNVGKRTDVDLNSVMHAVMDDLEFFLRDNNGAVDFEALPVLHKASETQLHQLLQNLISNGIKFHTPDRPPKVTVRHDVVHSKDVKALGLKAKRGDYHRFEISDNGIGFDEKYLDKIFAIFQRLHDRSTFKGSGIGLAMCRRICENHEGFLTARSVEGEGSVFTVLLPKK